MPHQCTGCGHTFPDGSKEMLSGCPECGGNKFQYFRGEAPPTPPADTTAPNSPGENRPVAEAVGRAANTVRDFVGSDPPPPAQSPEEQATRSTEPEPRDPDPGLPEDVADRTDAVVEREWPDEARPDDAEDPAQADARRGFFAGDELKRGGGDDTPSDPDLDDIRIAEEEPPPSEQVLEGDTESSTERSEPSSTPGLEELREELNDQFESIRIIEPGQYELNLMELYNREEYIIELQEDGRYVIEVPDTWRE